MKKSSSLRITSVFILMCFLVTQTGCMTLKPNEYAQHGYQGTPTVKEGARFVPIDILGNLIGLIPKIILFNWKVKRHHITEDTEQAVARYLELHQDTLGDVHVQLNRWAPGTSFKRLFKNKQVAWPYRYTLGFISVLVFDTLLIDRIFGGDRYNPYTHTVHLHSDLPSVALHELGHAQDFATRRHKGSYAFTRLIPLVDLYQEYKASEEVFEHTEEQGLDETKVEAYHILYPAYGTYVGQYVFIFGSLAGALLGHLFGRASAYSFKKMKGML